MEDYENDLKHFSEKLLNKKLEQYNNNINPSKQKGRSYYQDNTLKKEVQKHHSVDMSLYRRALEIKDKR